MKILKVLLSFAVSFIIGGIAGTAIATVAPIDPLVAGGAVLGTNVAVHVLQRMEIIPTFSILPGTFLCAIQQEFWVDYIIGNLFKANSFLNYCYDESGYVLNGKTVHVPQAGATPSVTKNRSSFPATASQRTDTEVTYDLDNYSTDPIHITNAEQLEISYDKMGNVLSEHLEKLREHISDDLLVKWAPSIASHIVRTTGADSATALAPSATLTRKKLTKEDLQSAQLLMDQNNIPEDDRYALIPAAMYQQLLTDTTLLGRDGIFGGEADIKRGIIGELYGFKLMKRSSVLVYDNAGTPVVKAVGAAGAATDNMAVICWQRNAVAKAMGSIKMFESKNDPLYFGDIYSAEVKMGGRKRRSTGYGCVAIVQQS